MSDSQTLLSIRVTRRTHNSQIAGPTSRVSASEDFGWGPSFCSSNKLPGDSDDAGAETTEVTLYITSHMEKKACDNVVGIACCLQLALKDFPLELGEELSHHPV